MVGEVDNYSNENDKRENTSPRLGAPLNKDSLASAATLGSAKNLDKKNNRDDNNNNQFRAPISSSAKPKLKIKDFFENVIMEFKFKTPLKISTLPALDQKKAPSAIPPRAEGKPTPPPPIENIFSDDDEEYEVEEIFCHEHYPVTGYSVNAENFVNNNQNSNANNASTSHTLNPAYSDSENSESNSTNKRKSTSYFSSDDEEFVMVDYVNPNESNNVSSTEREFFKYDPENRHTFVNTDPNALQHLIYNPLLANIINSQASITPPNNVQKLIESFNQKKSAKLTDVSLNSQKNICQLKKSSYCSAPFKVASSIGHGLFHHPKESALVAGQIGLTAAVSIGAGYLIAQVLQSAPPLLAASTAFGPAAFVLTCTLLLAALGALGIGVIAGKMIENHNNTPSCK